MADSQHSRSVDAWHVYLLLDPRKTGIQAIRYVGWTVHPKRRTNFHVSVSRGVKVKGRTRCYSWLKGLGKAGRQPVMLVIESGTGDEWYEAERGWITYYRMIGAPLTNHSDGGDGAPGAVPSAEKRAKIGAAHRGKKHSPEARERMKAAQAKAAEKRRGFKHTEEAKSRIRAGHLGKRKRPRTEAERARLSEFQRGNKKNPEAVEKTARAHRGKIVSEHTRMLLGASRRGKKLSDEHKAKLRVGQARFKQRPDYAQRKRAAARKTWATRRLNQKKQEQGLLFN